ncbi:MAG: hypothetical protein ABI812_05980 [Betaproteobacteria bacterium]
MALSQGDRSSAGKVDADARRRLLPYVELAPYFSDPMRNLALRLAGGS